MPERLSLVIGVASGLTGLLMLARLDIPVIHHGGLGAALAGLDLVVATVVVCALLGLATREW